MTSAMRGTKATGCPHAEPSTNCDDAARRPTFERTGSRFPAASRPAAVTPRGDRSRRFDETAYGTERFLGRSEPEARATGFHCCRPLARQGHSGPDPVKLFGAAWASAAAKDAPGDDRCLNHPGAPELGQVDRVCRKCRERNQKTFPWKERLSTFRGHKAGSAALRVIRSTTWLA